MIWYKFINHKIINFIKFYLKIKKIICKEIWYNKRLFYPNKINFNFGNCVSFEKIKIEGTYPNIDLVILISA